MTTKEDVKKLLNKYEEIEILENALLCERQLNIELQEQIEKMKNCENCKHWEDNDCQQEHTFDCKYWNCLNKFDYWEFKK